MNGQPGFDVREGPGAFRDRQRPALACRWQITVGRDLRATLSQLHRIYGHDQSLPQILDGLNARLGQARLLYGTERSPPAVVSGLYEKLDELRQLYGSESIEEILDGIIGRRRRINRMVKLQSFRSSSLRWRRGSAGAAACSSQVPSCSY
jgi:hypothetical protein